MYWLVVYRPFPTSNHNKAVMPKGKTYTPASVGVFLFLVSLTLQILHNVLSQLVLVGFVVVAELYVAV